jgi:hypothetical protein
VVRWNAHAELTFLWVCEADGHFMGKKFRSAKIINGLVKALCVSLRPLRFNAFYRKARKGNTR